MKLRRISERIDLLFAGIILIVVGVWIFAANAQPKLAVDKGKIKHFKIASGKLYYSDGSYTTPTMIGVDTVARIKYDSVVAIPTTNDSVTIQAKAGRPGWWDVIPKDQKNDLWYDYTIPTGFNKYFRSGPMINTKTGMHQDAKHTINGQAVRVLIPAGFYWDPGYSAAPKPASAVLDTASGTANQPDTVGLIHEFNFNSDTASGTTYDSVGSNDGTLTAGAYIETGSVHGDGCVEINGISQNVNIGNVSHLNGATAFTITAWVNQDVLNMVDYIFAVERTSPTANIYCNSSSDGNLYWSMYISGTNWGWVDYSDYVSANTWWHYAYVYDGSGAANADRLKGYINGAAISLSYTGTIPASTQDFSAVDFKIGRSSSAWDGTIDNFKIWNRALSANEIYAMYAATRERFQSTDTCNGFAESDTATRDQEVDTVIYWTESGSDTLEKPLADGLSHDISSLFTGTASYDTTVSGSDQWIDSIFTVDTKDTIYALNTNNAGQGNWVRHFPWVYFSDTTRIDTIAGSALDNTGVHNRLIRNDRIYDKSVYDKRIKNQGDDF